MLTCYCRACVELAQARLLEEDMKLKGRRKSTNVEDRRGSNIEITDGLTSEIVKTSYDNRKRRSDEYAASQPKPKVNPARTPKPKAKPTDSYVKLSGTLPWRRGG